MNVNVQSTINVKKDQNIVINATMDFALITYSESVRIRILVVIINIRTRPIKVKDIARNRIFTILRVVQWFKTLI